LFLARSISLLHATGANERYFGDEDASYSWLAKVLAMHQAFLWRLIRLALEYPPPPNVYGLSVKGYGLRVKI
jgi:hypothetical protein